MNADWGKNRGQTLTGCCSKGFVVSTFDASGSTCYLKDIWGHHTYLLLHFQRRVDIITLWLVWQEL